jgi:hypothetical protein
MVGLTSDFFTFSNALNQVEDMQSTLDSKIRQDSQSFFLEKEE